MNSLYQNEGETVSNRSIWSFVKGAKGQKLFNIILNAYQPKSTSAQRY